MKKILLAASCLLTGVLANAQSPAFEWAKNIGGYDGYANGSSIALDASLNVYTTGFFSGTIDFDPGPGVFYLASADNGYHVFISKTDASGNFVWVKKLAGSSNDRGYSIKVDASGNVYTTGFFEETTDFDPGPGTYNLTSAGSRDMFISKLNSSGNFVWAKRIGGTNYDAGISIALDASGNVYATGSFGATVDFDPGAGTFNLTASVGADVFIVQLDGSGNFVWAKQIEGSTSLDLAFSIALDGSGNIYTAGSFQGTSDFDPGAGIFNLTTTGSNDIFILKLNAAGNFVWAKQLGGPSSDVGYSIAVDGPGNVYTTGYFTLTSDFDPGAGTFNLTSVGIRDIFISKLDASGNFVWAKSIGGSDYDEGQSITIDASGNVCTTGYFGLTVDFDPGAGTFNLTNFGLDIFILKLDASGNFVWAKQLGGPSSDVGYSIAVDGSGNVYTTGYFQKTADFDPGAATFYLTNPGNDGGRTSTFVSKLTGAGNFVWACGAGSSPRIFSNSIAVDLSGNIYTTGYFTGMADFDPGAGTFYLTSAYGNDIFISKLDASGNFVWAKQMGGISDDRSFSIAVDGSGNVYTTGYFSGTADFDPGVPTYNLTATASADIFISKLDASGNFIWAKRLGGISSQINSGMSIALDGSGNVYTTGHFYYTVDFDPGAGTFNLFYSGGSVFISKLDASGNFVWAKQMGGYSADQSFSIAVDGSGNVYTSGNFKDTADFDPGAGTFNLVSAGDYDIFISKLNSSGTFVWAKRIGGTGRESGRSLAIDGSGNVYTTGDFDGTTDFDPDLAVTFNLTPASASDPDIFVSKLDASGNFVWAKQMGGTSEDIAYSNAVDGTGNVYTTGYFTGTADFDPGTGTFNLTIGRIFISKLDISGNFVWAKQMQGSSTSDYGFSIDVDAAGNIYTTGLFGITADFDPGAGTFNLTAYGGTDIFIHKMSQCTPPSAAITPAGPTTFCSGGSVVLNAPTGANKTYQWKKGANLISGATLSSYTATTGGNYRVIVTNTVTGCSKTTGSAVVVTVNSKPAATITPQGPTTFCAGGSVVLSANTGAGLTYKWKKGSNFISGATLSNYTATIAGTYRVEVTNSNGCSKTSAGVIVSVPCKLSESENESESAFDVKVYPNPNSGEFTIKFSNRPTSLIQIELADEIGKVVKRFGTNDETVVIKESNLAKGIYWLTVRNNNEVVIKKINIVK